jgi:hypothetical protein
MEVLKTKRNDGGFGNIEKACYQKTAIKNENFELREATPRSFLLT